MSVLLTVEHAENYIYLIVLDLPAREGRLIVLDCLHLSVPCRVSPHFVFLSVVER